MKKVLISEITENLDFKRKPLNNIERNKMKNNPEYPYYGANGQLDMIDEYIFDEEIICIAEDGGDWRKGSKCSYIVKNKCWVNNHAHVLRMKKDVNIKYLFYYLNNADLSSSITGTTRGKLTKSALNNLEIILPTLEIQKKIVEALDKAQDLIDSRKEQIRLMDELIQSVFYEMFGDPISNSKSLPIIELGKACHMKAGKNKKASEISGIYKEEMYPCFGGNGIRGYVKNYTHEGQLPLIGRQGALCGNVQFTSGKFYATEHAIVIQPLIGWNTTWLYIMLREMKLNRLASGAAQPGLNVGTLTPLYVINPEVELQNQFYIIVKDLEKLKFSIRESLIEMETLADSLMQKYFQQF